MLDSIPRVTTCAQKYHDLSTILFPAYADGMHGLHALILNCPEDPPAHAIFALGFMGGQAEKVASGTCPAFVVRPASAWFGWTEQAMELVCSHYGLCVFALPRERELWGYDQRSLTMPADLAYLATANPNTPHWHLMRARLCGIPANEVDTAYHLREGSRVRCEPGEADDD